MVADTQPDQPRLLKECISSQAYFSIMAWARSLVILNATWTESLSLFGTMKATSLGFFREPPGPGSL